MSEKYLIIGATGSIGSNLSKQLKNNGNDVHLVARSEEEVKALSSEIGCSYTVANVLNDGFADKIKSDINNIKGLAYCVGSIDLKPLKIVKEKDFHDCMKLNLYSDCIDFSKYVVICISSPLPIAPSSGTPAISVANLIHLVQWIHLVI